MKKLGVVCLVLIMSMGAMGVGYASWSQTLDIGGTVETGTWGTIVTLPPTQDSYINSNSATTNFGDLDYLIEGKLTSARQKALIQFDLTGIPSGAIIDSATLELYLTFTGNQDDIVNIYRLLRSWNEYEVTWEKYDSSTNWGTAGADNTENDFVNTVIASTTIPVGGQGSYYSWSGLNFTDEVQEFVDNPALNNGWIIYGVITGEQSSTFSSREDASNKPKLTIRYHMP